MSMSYWYRPAAPPQRARLLVALAAGALLAAGLLGIFEALRTRDLAPVPDCIDHTILVDQTDPLASERIKARLMATATSACAGARIIVTRLAADLEFPLEIIAHELVDPGPPDDKSWLFYSHQREALKRRSTFVLPVEEAIASALAEPARRAHSPILQAIASASHLPGFTDPGRRRVLVVVSDLLQHAGCSFLKPAKKKQSLAALCQTVIADHPADLQGVGVELWLIRRPRDKAAPQDEAFKRFWSDWLTASGASVTWHEVS